MTRAICVSFCVFSCLFVAIPPARADEAPVKVSFDMLPSRHLVVQAKVNGKGPYRFIFDTGAPIMLLSRKVGREAGLLDKDGGGKKPPTGPASFGTVPGQVTIGKLELGGLAAEDLPGVVMDHPTVGAIAKVFGPIEGIVGFPFFARFRTTIDYQAKELTFTPNGYKPADLMQTMMATLMKQANGRNQPAAPKVVVPAGQWGVRVEKGEGDDAPGVTLAAVLPGGAADKAGLRTGDRLLTIDGRWTDGVMDCFRAASAVKAGEAVEVVVRRGGREVKANVTPLPGL
jgi:Aspartyl protease/PDZ domain